MGVKILSVSDVVVPAIYSPLIRDRFNDITFVISCGDLPYYYLEYIVSMLDAPLFFVRGNHDQEIELKIHSDRTSPAGGSDLHGKVLNYQNLLIAGIEGSIRYRPGPFMYTQTEMWLQVMNLAPRLIYNRIRYGRFLDIFVAHASPWGIHDKQDFAHQGIRAFLWLIQVFQPRFYFHGHVHVYHPDEPIITVYGKTRIVNTYGYQEIVII